MGCGEGAVVTTRVVGREEESEGIALTEAMEGDSDGEPRQPRGLHPQPA